MKNIQGWLQVSIYKDYNNTAISAVMIIIIGDIRQCQLHPFVTIKSDYKTSDEKRECPFKYIMQKKTQDPKSDIVMLTQLNSTQNIFYWIIYNSIYRNMSRLKPNWVYLPQSIWFTYKVWYDLHSRQSRLVEQNKKQHKSCCKFHTLGNYSLDLVNTNQLHNWR